MDPRLIYLDQIQQCLPCLQFVAVRAVLGHKAFIAPPEVHPAPVHVRAGWFGRNRLEGINAQGTAREDDGGFTAFALVYLARLNSLAIIPFAFFFSFLLVGGASMPRRADVPTYYIEVLEGLMLIFFACTVYFERRFASAITRARTDDLERAAPPLVAEPAAVGTGVRGQ